MYTVLKRYLRMTMGVNVTCIQPPYHVQFLRKIKTGPAVYSKNRRKYSLRREIASESA
jgi:hypothetical protein